MADSLYINEQLQSQLVFLNFSSFLLLLSLLPVHFHILTNVNKSVFIWSCHMSIEKVWYDNIEGTNLFNWLL